MDPKQESKTKDLIKNTKCVCLDDYRALAKKALPKPVFIYIDSGADDQITLTRNVQAFRQIVFKPRILRDGHNIDLRVKLFGKQLSMPVGFAPWAMNKIANKELGEKGPAKVAAKLNLPYILSTLTNTSLKQIDEIYPKGPKFLQVYLCNDWQLNLKLIQIAQRNNFDGLVITVDAQVLGTRRKQIMYKLDSSKYEFPLLEQISSVKSDGPKERVSYLKNRDLTLNWETIAKIRSLTKLKIILKGILHPLDAIAAVKVCDAIYISNHGGRQLDTVPATIEVLPSIVKAVRQINKQIPIFIDGGVRTGNDIFKCLALGANYVFVGRPVAYSLIQGQQGVENMAKILKDELIRCMILNGANSIENIKSQYLGFRSKL